MDWILHHGALVMIFLGGLVAAAGAFLAERRASAPKHERHKQTWPAVILAGALVGGLGTFWGGYQQDQLSAFLSGDDSYGYLTVGPQTATSIEYILVEHGDAPFYDVMIDVHDMTKFDNLMVEKGIAGRPPQRYQRSARGDVDGRRDGSPERDTNDYSSRKYWPWTGEIRVDRPSTAN